jgi:hypothetical protein
MPNRSKESVPAPWQGLNKPGVISRVPQGHSQLCHSYVNGLVEVAKTFVGPDPLTQFLTSNNLARALQQDFEELNRLLLHTDPNPRPVKLSRLEIDLISPKAHHGCGLLRRHASPFAGSLARASPAQNDQEMSCPKCPPTSSLAGKVLNMTRTESVN